MTSVAESNAISRLLRWVTGTGTGITTEQAREAAGFLASRSYRVLAAGITPAEVAGNWPAQPLPELNARVKAALDLIAEHDGPEAQHSEHWKWVSVRQALTGEATT